MGGKESNLELEATEFRRSGTSKKRRRIIVGPAPIAIVIAFVLLGLAATFLFGARAVKFNITPTPDTLEIASGLITYRLGERFLMLPGDYRIRARAAGYHELNTNIEVGDAADQDIHLSMVRLPGVLIANTDPVTRTEVLIDQNSRGFTPLAVDDIEPGLHDVLFVNERYLPYQTEIDIEGRQVKQMLTAQLSPAWANVEVSSRPAAADITIDGESVGRSPMVIEVIRGKHTIGLRKKGYKHWQSELTVAAGEAVSLDTVSLTESDGKVSIGTTPDGANVTIAGRYRGKTPLSVSLAPGNAYPVVLSKAGFEVLRRKINLEPEQDLSLNLSMKPVMGVVRLQVQPEDSELFLDGVAMGRASQRLSLTATRHRVEIRKPGFATYTETVTPQPGLTQQLLINLQTEDEARAAAIPVVLTPLQNVTAKLIIPDKLSMGASRREPGRRSNEIEKEVLLTRAFYLGTHEITNKSFKEFDPAHESGLLGRSLLGDDDRPVNVDWDQIVGFCNWLSIRNGLPVAYVQQGGAWHLARPVNTGYRLPTEAEWSWSARYDRGTPTRFPWGDSMPPDAVEGNYADESAANMVPYHVIGYNDTYRGPAPVGSFDPNAFGIYDLNGNVSEWVGDYYSVVATRELLKDPIGPDTGEYHVIRGANYTNGRFSELRWTFRDYGAGPRPDVGFRIARYVE